MKKKIAIIGGGAAGMMAAARIAELDADIKVVLFEKNPSLGRKVIISGGGRCNVTTGIQDVRAVLSRYARGNKFLNSAMWNFPPAAVYDWFEGHGVPLKTEDDQRVFPKSNDGADIVDVFERLFADANVELRLKSSVRRVSQSGPQATTYIVESDNQLEEFDAIILTTGGQAYRHTGSTGDGYSFAESMGHHITPLAASLNSFMLSDKWIKSVPGVSFTDVLLTSSRNLQHKSQGAIVCTHTGISGPAVFALSAQIAFEDYTKANPLTIYIDWLPNESSDSIRAVMNNACEQYPKRQLNRLLHDWLPKSLVTQILEQLNIDEQIPLAELSKSRRTILVEQLKRSSVNLIGRSSGSEFVTAGGVDTDEINPKTMESRISPGLFFAGEIMNVDGVTGGFNLQASWAAGYLAAEGAIGFLV
ncbi:MAG: hypothetical protein COW24_01845 [Candidatus Kerfeldbacteria bacterium CG15_BIG_FIL_POST_REV_8_21_14_020_45_12]|uniref:Aminoacetone oxidase family FAD-binding enzyme n=1 Tax=Candidatus Kerfeldbacteria bacterium CG15_BIG_FIL_POST_REV_8_21_14_020_45_12 TaxID=2014247 RepID=A0A2M7H4H4_9BACT|nr:MAG: hypothetical protein COW24_01845 [Candidatus Kerfeldbacteria bacterium CG15_BIG_FIL_POST_REV_8_21_14_020_45_12]PJA93168.1 MAG: hypothetical protein CO132_04265 [Candidatus Kerfeldbacteria bacterium CG_4_9_14_3_um_filter_45_8]